MRLKAVDSAKVALPCSWAEIGFSKGIAAYSWVRTSSAVTTRVAVVLLPAGWTGAVDRAVDWLDGSGEWATSGC